MPKNRKKKKGKKVKIKEPEQEPIGTFISAEPNIKPSEKKKKDKKNKKNKKNKKSKGKTTKSNTKNKKKDTKKSKTKSKTEKKPKSKSKDKKSKTKHKKDTKKAKTANNKDPAPTETAQESKQEENTESTTQSKPAFPWANWAVDLDEKDGSHRTRRSSLGSIRELYIARAKKQNTAGAISGKKGGGHRKKSHKQSKSKKHKRSKSKKKKKGFQGDFGDKHDINSSTQDVDIYDPQAMKEKRRKDKQKEKFKVVPKHHVKRSSLPTYQSVRKNNPKLAFLVRKETQRNLASLYDQPEKRAKSKALKNLSRGGFVIHVNHRYRLEDGRIGVCKYRGRTQFGKSSEDWLGLVIQVGIGEHDGSVQGATYFRCRMGKGLFVRPYDVIEDMGSQNKMLSKQDIKLAEANIKRYKKQNEKGTTTSSDVVERDQFGNVIADHGDNMDNEKLFNPKSLLDKNKGKKARKKKHHTQV